MHFTNVLLVIAVIVSVVMLLSGRLRGPRAVLTVVALIGLALIHILTRTMPHGLGGTSVKPERGWQVFGGGGFGGRPVVSVVESTNSGCPMTPGVPLKSETKKLEPPILVFVSCGSAVPQTSNDWAELMVPSTRSFVSNLAPASPDKVQPPEHGHMTIVFEQKGQLQTGTGGEVRVITALGMANKQVIALNVICRADDKLAQEYVRKAEKWLAWGNR